MPNIKPISDLTNYMELLGDIAVGNPVFLTQDGCGRYALIDMKEYERMRATIRLFSELSKGEQSAKDAGWISENEIDAELGLI